MGDGVDVGASGPLLGQLRVPGDKSISHRALILAALASGPSHIRGLSDGADVRATWSALTAMGISIEQTADGVRVTPPESGWREPKGVLDCGNSGTSIRLLCGVLAAKPGLAILTGDESLCQRPMGRIVRPLQTMGAQVDGRVNGTRPPLVVRGGPLAMAHHDLSVASAQVKSALMLAGLDNGVAVREPAQSRDHTERMLRAAGVPVRRDAEGWLLVVGGTQPTPVDWQVPSDVSAAAFFLVAATLVPGSDLVLPGVGMNPTRSGVIDVLIRMGANIEATPVDGDGVEPRADLRVRHSVLHATDIAGDFALRALDELPILAVAAAFAQGVTTVSGAAELRVKESDRIARVTIGLRALGIEVEEHPDGMTIWGGCPAGPAEIDVGGDHRLAMAFAVAGLASAGGVRLLAASSVESSYPSFFRDLASVAGS